MGVLPVTLVNKPFQASISQSNEECDITLEFTLSGLSIISATFATWFKSSLEDMIYNQIIDHYSMTDQEQFYEKD